MHLSRKEGTAIKVAPSSSLCAAGMKRRFLASILCLASPNSIGTHSFPKTSPSARLASNFSMENRGDQRRQIGQAGVFYPTSPYFSPLFTTSRILYTIYFKYAIVFQKKFAIFFIFFAKNSPFPRFPTAKFMHIYKFSAL